MSTVIEYKGYHAVIDDFDAERGRFHGRVVDIQDVITFVGSDGHELVTAFHDSVDDYLEWAAEEGFEPARPYSGQFTVRVHPELHRMATVAAVAEGKSLNQWITDVMEQAARKQVAVKTVTS